MIVVGTCLPNIYSTLPTLCRIHLRGLGGINLPLIPKLIPPGSSNPDLWCYPGHKKWIGIEYQSQDFCPKIDVNNKACGPCGCRQSS